MVIIFQQNITAFNSAVVEKNSEISEISENSEYSELRPTRKEARLESGRQPHWVQRLAASENSECRGVLAGAAVAIIER